MPLARRIGLFLISEILLLLIAAIIIEGVSRAAIHFGLVPREDLRMRGQLVVRPHPFLGFCLREQATRGGDPATVQKINNQGYRGKPITTKAADEYRVLCVGDSVMYGDSLGEEDTLPARLEETLTLQIKTKKVRVINAGVLQYTSAETLAAIALRGIDLRPDAVIFYQGANDVAPRLVRPFKSDYSHYRNVWERDSERRADKRLETFDGYVTLRWLAGIYPGAGRIDYYTTRPFPKVTYDEQKFAFYKSGNETFLRNEAAGVALARSVGARSLIVATASNVTKEDGGSFFTLMINENRRKQGQVAAKQGANFYELPDDFSKNPANFRDNVHFTADGARAAAQHIAGEMIKLGWTPK